MLYTNLRTSRLLVCLFAAAFIVQATGQQFKGGYRHLVKPTVATKILQGADCEQVSEHTRIVVKPDGSNTLEYETAYMLYSERSFPIAEVLIPYNRSYQKAEVLYAHTIRADGRKVGLDRRQIFEGTYFESNNLYSDLALMRFSMPAVERGCRIEFAYRVSSKPFLLPREFWHTWMAMPGSFIRTEQGPSVISFPLRQTKLTVEVPSSMKLKVRVVGDLSESVSGSMDSGGTTKYEWTAQFLTPLEIEPLMGPIVRVMSQVELSTIPSWTDLALKFESFFRPTGKLSPEIESMAKRLTEGKTSKHAKAKAICDWVAAQIRYVGIELGMSAFKPHSPNDVMNRKYGDCKDKVNLAMAMLAHVGISARPLLASAWDSLVISDRLPNPYCFDHVVCEIDLDDGPKIADVTDSCFPFDEPPGSVRGGELLSLSAANGFRKVAAWTTEDNGCSQEGTIRLNAAGDADISVTRIQRGWEAITSRRAVRDLADNEKNESAQRQFKVFSQTAVLRDFSIQDGDGNPRTFLTKLSGEIRGFASRSGNLILVPIGKLFDLETPLDAKTRKYPLYMGTSSSHNQVFVIEIPSGFAVEELPAPIESTIPIRSNRLSAVVSQDGATVAVSQLRSFRAAEMPPEDYAKAVAHFEAVSRAGGWVLILKKSGA